ncbi:hypothetical protein F66182_6964 [Fusarium sp. NRRL 66182]|nr:hypothetical protein F66182_6964 [Fusarium sp. NRRL 66182]
MNSTSKPSLPVVWRSQVADEEYERVRTHRIFNKSIPSRYPRAIVQATEEAHIIEAVRLAIQEKCRVSIRSGGHSWPAWSLRDDAVLIDLTGYDSIEFDEKEMVATVSAGATGGQLHDFLATKGLFFPVGHCPDVAMGGFMLNGGMGWNCKNWGWSAEQLVAIDVVTAQGELVHCDQNHHSDLFWCARGSGPGFPAVASKFYVKVQPYRNFMMSSLFVYPLSQYRQVMDWLIKISPDYDSDTEVVAVSATPPPALGIEEHCLIPLFVTWKNTEAEARAALERADQTRPEGFLVELPSQRTSMAKEFRDQATANPSHGKYCVDGAYIRDGEDVAAAIEEIMTTLPHPLAYALWVPMLPCSKIPLSDMAHSLQSDHYLSVYSIWEDDSQETRGRTWLRDAMSRLEKHSIGMYIADSDFQVRPSRYWSEANGKKLMELRRKLDPEGVICGFLDTGDRSGVHGLANKHEGGGSTERQGRL